MVDPGTGVTHEQLAAAPAHGTKVLMEVSLSGRTNGSRQCLARQHLFLDGASQSRLGIKTGEEEEEEGGKYCFKDP